MDIRRGKSLEEFIAPDMPREQLWRDPNQMALEKQQYVDRQFPDWLKIMAVVLSSVPAVPGGGAKPSQVGKTSRQPDPNKKYMEDWAKAYETYQASKALTDKALGPFSLAGTSSVGKGDFTRKRGLEGEGPDYVNLPPRVGPPVNERMVDQLGVGRLRMGPKEPDPEVIRQLGVKQTAGGISQGFSTNPSQYDEGVFNSVPPPSYVADRWLRAAGLFDLPGGTRMPATRDAGALMAMKSEQFIPEQWFKEYDNMWNKLHSHGLDTKNLRPPDTPDTRMFEYLERLKQKGLWP